MVVIFVGKDLPLKQLLRNILEPTQERLERQPLVVMYVGKDLFKDQNLRHT